LTDYVRIAVIPATVLGTHGAVLFCALFRGLGRDFIGLIVPAALISPT
jgi:hypothetical protein